MYAANLTTLSQDMRSEKTFDAAKAEEGLQMEPLEMQSDSSHRAMYFEVGIPDIFSHLPKRFINVRKFAARIVAIFGSTY